VEARRVARGITVGLATDDVDSYASAEAASALARGGEELLRTLRARSVPIELPRELPYGAMVHVIHLAEGATAHAELIESERLNLVIEPMQRAALRDGLRIAARDYLRAMRLRAQVSAAFRAIFDECNVIVAVGRSVTATPIDAPVNGSALEDRLYSASVDRSAIRGLGNRSMSGASNLAGLPAVFFPVGVGTDGLPVGLQLIGPPFSEHLLIALASAYQRATEHHRRRPPRVAA
jgi:Asp-tRNA(Asn)/Glu-tRNA(Gln) amidotransferase A subunit family amidase